MLTNQLQRRNLNLNDPRNLGLPDNLARLLASQLQQQDSRVEQPATNKRQCLETDQEPMELDMADTIVPGELNYDLISILPPTVGESLMQILWARAMPSKL
jgi:hypothetical protein